MMRAALNAAEEESLERGFKRPLIFGVTVLSSLSAPDLVSMGVAGSVSVHVKRLALIAKKSGLDGVVAYSAKAAREYEAFGVSADRVFIAHNAVADEESKEYLDKLGQDLTWVNGWKAKYGLAHDLPVVLYVGRLIPQKRVDVLIDACLPLLNRSRLLIVGDGPARQDLER